MGRVSGPMEINRELRGLLFEIRSLSGISTDPSIDISQLIHTEQVLGFNFPNDLLAVIAAQLEVLESDYDLRLPKIPKIAKIAWEKGCPKKWIAVGHVDFHVFICISRYQSSQDATILFDYCREDNTTRSFGLISWLLEIRDGLYDALLEDKDQREYIRSNPMPLFKEGDVIPFQPILLEPYENKQRKVVHPKYGEGKVLRILEDNRRSNPKLEIDFSLVGTKVTSTKHLKFFDELF